MQTKLVAEQKTCQHGIAVATTHRFWTSVVERQSTGTTPNVFKNPFFLQGCIYKWRILTMLTINTKNRISATKIIKNSKVHPGVTQKPKTQQQDLHGGPARPGTGMPPGRQMYGRGIVLCPVWHQKVCWCKMSHERGVRAHTPKFRGMASQI